VLNYAYHYFIYFLVLKKLGFRGFWEWHPTFNWKRDSLVRYRKNTNYAKVKTIQVPNPSKNKSFFCSPKFPEPLEFTHPLTQWVPIYFMVGKEARAWIWPLTPLQYRVKYEWSHISVSSKCLFCVGELTITFPPFYLTVRKLYFTTSFQLFAPHEQYNNRTGFTIHSGVVSWGTALQVARSRYRFPIGSLGVFIDLIFLDTLFSWDPLRSFHKGVPAVYPEDKSGLYLGLSNLLL
jgi:hypothetical protein